MSLLYNILHISNSAPFVSPPSLLAVNHHRKGPLAWDDFRLECTIFQYITAVMRSVTSLNQIVFLIGLHLVRYRSFHVNVHSQWTGNEVVFFWQEVKKHSFWWILQRFEVFRVIYFFVQCFSLAGLSIFFYIKRNLIKIKKYYSNLLHLPTLRFHCVGGYWEWTYRAVALTLTRSKHSARSQLLFIINITERRRTYRKFALVLMSNKIKKSLSSWCPGSFLSVQWASQFTHANKMAAFRVLCSEEEIQFGFWEREWTMDELTL